jgi:predicted O-methyltransferase YrrM
MQAIQQESAVPPAPHSLLRRTYHKLPTPLRLTIRRVITPLVSNHDLVSQLHATVLQRDAAIREREATTRMREQKIAELERLLRERERRIAELEQGSGGHETKPGATPETADVPPVASGGEAALPRSGTAARDALSGRIIAALPAMEGWCTERKALWLADLIAENACHTVLEIGIYGGKSLIPMALAVRQYAPDGTVYGIEAWSGEVAVETPTTDANDAWWRNLDFKFIKTSFLRNMVDNDLADIIKVFEMSSDAAYRCLTAIGLKKFDLIHVDGSHSEIQALRDVKTWSALLRPGGILVMDDIGWATVQPAREYAKSHFSVIEEVFETAGVAYGAYRIER